MFENGSNWIYLNLLNKIVNNKPDIPNKINGDFYHITVLWMTWYLNSEYYRNKDVYDNLISND